MDPTCSCGGSSSDFDVGFAFNDSNFSDRVLRIEITTDPVNAPSKSDIAATANADQVRHGKRKRENVEDAALPDENQDEETVEELSSGVNNNDSTLDGSAGTVVSVKILHINSLILAAKSTFFHKLFSNGMRESEERHVTLKVNASEEVSLMELLNFMYRNSLNITAPTDLLDVLIAADKFGVYSCMRYCTKLLLNSPMTTDSALLYLDLPHSILVADTFQPLADAAKKYLADRYKDITKFEEEVMTFPVCGIEAILASDDLEVESEDVICDFVLGWAREHYNILEERREVLGTRLAPLIRFPHMTCQKLEEVLTCDDFKHKGTSELVLTALIFKARPLHRQLLMAAEAKVFDSLNVCSFMERAYKCRPVKVVEYELPRQGCVVYLDLMRDECSALFPSLEVCSQTFHLAGHEFFLTAQCNILDEQRSTYCFGLYLGMHSCSESFTVGLEFSARCRRTLEFVTKAKCNCTFPTGGGVYGITNLFAIPWTSFMAKDCPLFINGVLHLKAELTIKH